MTARERLSQIDAAISKIENGGQEYQIGRERLVRADLGKLYAERRSLAAQVADEDNGGSYIAIFEGR